MDRRHFVSALAGATAAPGLSGFLPPTYAPSAIRRLLDAGDVAKSRGASLLAADAAAWRGDSARDAAFANDEDFWEPVQRAFDLDRSWINLNNGGCSPAPTHVLDQMIRDIKYSNELPVIQMWRDLEPRIELSAEVMDRARVPLERMLEMAGRTVGQGDVGRPIIDPRISGD